MLDDIHLGLLHQPLIGALDPTHVALLRRITRIAHFASGEFVFHVGEAANEFYLLREGLVALQMDLRGRRLTIATVGASELLGVSWLLPSRRWAYDAFVVRPVSALAVDVDGLTSLCEQEHSLGYGFMKQVGRIVERRARETAIQACDLYSDWS